VHDLLTIITLRGCALVGEFLLRHCRGDRHHHRLQFVQSLSSSARRLAVCDWAARGSPADDATMTAAMTMSRFHAGSSRRIVVVACLSAVPSGGSVS
jgi:hypothetical protein